MLLDADGVQQHEPCHGPVLCGSAHAALYSSALSLLRVRATAQLGGELLPPCSAPCPPGRQLWGGDAGAGAAFTLPCWLCSSAGRRVGQEQVLWNKSLP